MGIDGVLPSRRGWAWDPSTPLAGLWERTEHKERGWPSELGDRAALIRAHPELGGPSVEVEVVFPKDVLSGRPRLLWLPDPFSPAEGTLPPGLSCEVGWGCEDIGLLSKNLSEEISLL